MYMYKDLEIKIARMWQIIMIVKKIKIKIITTTIIIIIIISLFTLVAKATCKLQEGSV